MRKKLPLTNIFIIVALGLLTTLSSVLSGIVSSQIPPSLTKYLHYAWLAFGIVTLLLIGLTVWQFWLQAGTEPSAVDTRENRRIMLNRVRAKWIAGFLENPLYYDEQLLPLPLRERVGSRYDLALYNPLDPARPLPPDTKILNVFDQARGQLLILGEPGVGKTTLLLELARDLLQRTKTNEEVLIPTVLTLSSWATKRLPLEQWVIEELKTKYQVTTEIGRAWVRDNQLLLLLDGLDEVAPHAQPDCIQAVNSFIRQRQAHPSLVVCSRTKEYLEQRERLFLPTAVVVQPLSPQQVDNYLSNLGEEVDGLKRTLQQSEPLRTLATTPFLLKVLILAYHGKSVQDLLSLVNTAPTGQQPRLFHDYVERMLQREGAHVHASVHQTKQWLTWLADQLMKHHQSELYLEQFQPDWLPTKRRVIYRLTVGLFICLFILLPFALLLGLLGGQVGGLVFGLVFGLLFSLTIELRGALLFGLVFGLIYGLSQIQPREILTQSWRWRRRSFIGGLLGWLVGGLVFGLPFALLGGLVDGLLSGLVFGLPFALFGGLLGGFSTNQLDDRQRLTPNQGIWRSALNGLFGGLLGGLLFGLPFVLLFVLLGGYGLVGGLSFWLRDGLLFVLLGGLLAMPGFGLAAFLQQGAFHFFAPSACLSRRGEKVCLPQRY